MNMASEKFKLKQQKKNCTYKPKPVLFCHIKISLQREYYRISLIICEVSACLSQILRESGFASTVLIIRLLTTKTYVSSIAQGFLASYIKGLVNYLFQYKHHIFLMKLQTEQKYDFLRIEYATITGTLQFMINT